MSESQRLLGNRYEMGDLLGRGGMAEVYLGRDTRLGRVVAIKLLRIDLARDPVFQARFWREAQSAAALNHPSIVAVYDTGEEPYADAAGNPIGLPYIVMEYVDGQTLKEMLADGPLDIDLAIDATSRVLSALEYSHRAGIVHRDIKPANVMRTANGEIKVMDFGIARAMADSAATMTATQSVIGTAQYLSPEQARGETVDTRSDLYSAGCLLFELVTGRPPFVADSPVAVAYQHVREAPPAPSMINPAIPADLERVILHALAKDRESRYQTAAEFRTDLANVRAGRPVSAAAEATAMATEVLGAHAGATQAVDYSGATAQLPPRDGWAGQTSQLPGAGVESAGYPVVADSRQAERRRDSDRRGNRGGGFVLLGLVTVAVFAASAYLVWNIFAPKQPQTAVVPTLVGLTEGDARAKLGTSFVVGNVTQEPSEKIIAGRILKQTPQANSTAELGSSIDLVISSGTNQVEIPDLSDVTVDQATAALEKSELVVAATPESVDSAIKKGRVVGTSPAAGTFVTKGSTVTLRVSSGQVEMPDLIGKTYDEAVAELRKFDLNATRTTAESDQPEGTVIDQNPKAGTKVDAESVTVNLTTAIPIPAPPPSPVQTPPSVEPPATPDPGTSAEPSPSSS